MNNALCKQGSAAGETIGSAISQARETLFTGRRQELHAFERLLEAGEFPRVVLVHGPGGIGKSSLLDGFARISNAHDLPFEHIDARLLPATPDTLRQAVTAALPTDGGSRPAVIAVDHAEQIAALERWLRLELLPGLPLNTVLILAGRNRPDAEWYADPGLQPYIQEFELRPFDDQEAAEYLQRRTLNPALRDKVQRFARGHPLALALTADHLQRHGADTFDAADAPDLIQTLVGWMLRDIDDPPKLTALRACATVRRLDAPLLKAIIGHEYTDALFDWLAEQPIIERQREGVVIHDLVRELVVRDLRGRDLNRHHELIRRAATYLLAILESEFDHAAHRWLSEIMYTLRHEPYMQHHFPFDDNSYYPDRAQPDEWSGLAEEIERLQGSDSRGWFEHWLKTNPERLTVIRDKTRTPVAVVLTVVFSSEDIAPKHDDPAVDGLFRYLREYAPLRPGEGALLVRFAQAHRTGQARSPVWVHVALVANSLLFTSGVRLGAYESDLSVDWRDVEEIGDTLFLPGTEYTIGGRRYMLGGRESLRETPMQWVRNCIERVLLDGSNEQLTPPNVVVLEKPAFETAVKDALRNFHDDKALYANSLLRTPVLHRYAQSRSPETLRGLLKHTSEKYLGGDEDRSFRTALRYAYFQPRRKLTTAAAELHVSERTFRRRLREAEAQLIERLWQWETSAGRN